MVEHLLKDDVKSTAQRKKIAAKNVQTQTVNSMLMQRESSYLPSREVVQRQIYYYDTTTKKMIEIKNLEEFNRCLHDYGYLQAAENLVYENFPEEERLMVDEAIESLNDGDIGTIASAQDAIDLIQRRIREVIAGAQAQAEAADAAEQERIRVMAASLDGKWVKSNGRKKGGIFIGDPSKWHIHTEIDTQEHLTYGRDEGARADINNYVAIEEAVRYLIRAHGLGADSGKDCYRWLRHAAIVRHGRDLSPELHHDDI